MFRTSSGRLVVASLVITRRVLLIDEHLRNCPYPVLTLNAPRVNRSQLWTLPTLG